MIDRDVAWSDAVQKAVLWKRANAPSAPWEEASSQGSDRLATVSLSTAGGSCGAPDVKSRNLGWSLGS